MDIEDLDDPDLSDREWEELNKTFYMPDPPTSTPTESTVIDTNQLLDNPYDYQCDEVRAELEAKVHDQITKEAEEEALCQGLSNINMTDIAGDEGEKEIVDETWGAIGQFEDTEYDCSWCKDIEEQGSVFQIRSASVFSNNMVWRLRAPTLEIPI